MSRTDRIYLRIDPKLKGKIREYCWRNDVSLSDIVTRFFVRLLESEKPRENADVDQA
jgi:hypothetical protein